LQDFSDRYEEQVETVIKRIWNETLTLLTLAVLITLVLPAGLTPTYADSATFSDISEIDQEVFYFGDILEIQGSLCYSSKKPTAKSAKQRLQIYLGTSWRNVGTVKFLKSSSICGNKNPYLQIFEWEVDQLGTITDGRGSLRLRDSTAKPSKYVQAYVFESRESATKWTENRGYEAERGFMCLISGGQWDSTRKICVGGSDGI